jgi:hypothetical protein
MYSSSPYVSEAFPVEAFNYELAGEISEDCVILRVI